MTKQKKQMFILGGGVLFLAVYWTLPLLTRNKGEETTEPEVTAPAEAGSPEETPAEPPSSSPEPAPTPQRTAGLLTAPPAVPSELKTARPPGYSPFEPLIKPTPETSVSPGNEGQTERPSQPPKPPSISTGSAGAASLPPAPVVPSPVWTATPQATPAASTSIPSAAALSQAQKAKGPQSGPATSAPGSKPAQPPPDSVPPPPPAGGAEGGAAEAEAPAGTEPQAAASGPPGHDSGFVSPPGLPVPYQLVGILQGPPRMAILRNGEQRHYVRERETLANQFLIERIRDHQVWLRLGSQRILLEMGEQAHEQG